MIKSRLFIFSILLLTGCAIAYPSLQQIQSTNRSNLNKISLGMTKVQVLEIMGTTTITSVDGTMINSPFRSETTAQNGLNYEITFFYTDTKKADGSITDDELTPVVYFEGKVVGYGWSYLKDNIKKYQLDIR